MDPPDSNTTNICCLGNASEIAWVSCTLKSDDVVPNERNPALNPLYMADLAIRLVGGCSHLDVQANRLLIFDLPKEWSGKGSDYLGLDSAVELAKSHGLQKTDRGTLFSHDFGSPGDSSNNLNAYGKRERSNEIMDLNASAVARNQLVELSSDRSLAIVQDSDNHHLTRNCLLLAIQSTCIVALLRSHYYISLGTGLFCSTDYTNYGREPFTPDASLNDMSWKIPLWSINVLWQTNGAFLISYNQVIHKDVASLPNNLDLDTDIVLAPLGWTARALSSSSCKSIEQGSSDNQLGFGSLWRSHCLHLIRQHGLQVEDDLEWIAVELSSTDRGDVSGVIEWPHRFCLVISNNLNRSLDSKSLEVKDSKIWVDPLREAAEWVKDTNNREKLVKEQLSAKSGKNSSRLLQNLAEEEALAHLQTRNEEGLDAQTIAGIYPTPPDVNKNHSHTHTETNPSLLGQSEESHAGNDKDHRTTRNLSPALDASVGIASYDPLKDDDLFSDMDGGMDGDNGVTEDDFRFFDEPEESEFLISNPDLTDDVAQEPMVETPEEINERNTKSPEIAHGTHVEAPIEEDTVDIETLKPHTPDPDGRIFVPPDVSAIPMVLTAEPVIGAVPQTLDAKYGAAGKYAWKNAQRPLTNTPFTRIEQDKGIPLIRDNLFSTPSSTGTPSSEPTYQVGNSQEAHNSSVDEMDSFLEQTRMLNQFITGCNTFEVGYERKKYGRDWQDTSVSISPSVLEHQSQGSIQLAQIVADQSIFYDFLVQEHNQSSKPLAFSQTADLIGAMLQRRFLKYQPLTLQQCARTEMNSDVLDNGTIPSNMLSPPTMRVKRADSILELSDTALDFWKELSIKPLHGPKDITAICLCEEGEVYRVGSVLFLQSMEDTYRSLNLGSHSAGHPSLNLCSEGVVSVPGLDASAANAKTPDTFWSQLGKSLAVLATVKTTIVVYIVKPDNGILALTSLCLLFQKIFGSYASMSRKADRPSDLVLQIIPSSMIASGMQQVFPNLRHHVTISKIVYNRCPTTEQASSVYSSASMVQLAQPLPTSIEFKISSDSSMYPSGAIETFHLAYSYTKGSHWLSASMIDSFGSKQWNASYHLGEYKDPKFVLTAVINEIWEIVRLATDYRRTYNVFVVKTTQWSPVEIEIWKNLAHGAKVPLFMLTYDASCPIVLKENKVKMHIDALESELAQIPPTPDVASPDPTGTKLEEQDTIHRLIDTKNQAWWIPTKQIMAMESGSFSIREHLTSSYLIYKNTPVITLSVVASTHAVDMAVIVEVYHGLRALSRAQCVHSHLPWHLAIAEGAQSGLEKHLNQYNTI